VEFGIAFSPCSERKTHSTRFDVFFFQNLGEKTMWIKLDLEGIVFHFRISCYRKSTKQDWDCEWCSVDLSLCASDWLQYYIVEEEIMLCVEVQELLYAVDSLLNDMVEKTCDFDLIEPDLSFTFYPKSDVRDNPRVIYAKPGCEITDVLMDFIVSFWDRDGALSDNKLVMTFDRKDLEKLLCYLNLVTGKIDRENELVKQLIKNGCFYG
jgi:hypothetical protein